MQHVLTCHSDLGRQGGLDIAHGSLSSCGHSCSGIPGAKRPALLLLSRDLCPLSCTGRDLGWDGRRVSVHLVAITPVARACRPHCWPPPVRCRERPRALRRGLRTAVKCVLAGSFLEVAVKQPLPPGACRNGPENKAHTQMRPERPGRGLASPRVRPWPGCRED